MFIFIGTLVTYARTIFKPRCCLNFQMFFLKLLLTWTTTQQKQIEPRQIEPRQLYLWIQHVSTGGFFNRFSFFLATWVSSCKLYSSGKRLLDSTHGKDGHILTIVDGQILTIRPTDGQNLTILFGRPGQFLQAGKRDDLFLWSMINKCLNLPIAQRFLLCSERKGTGRRGASPCSQAIPAPPVKPSSLGGLESRSTRSNGL